MASGKEISVNDLPEELKKKEDNSSSAAEKQYGDMSNKLPLDLSWQNLLKDWVSQKLHEGCTDILAEAQPEFEKALITTALRYTHDHKQEAARLLGWGRNTLTRKLKDLNLE